MSTDIEKVLAFIPLRSGSKGVPDKNIKEINGKPLFYWTLKAVVDAGITRIFVSTDSSEYARMVTRYFPIVHIVYRSKEASSDSAATEDSVLEFLGNCPWMDPLTKILLIQATSPMLTGHDIVSMLDTFEASKVKSMLSVVDISERFIWDGNGRPRNYDYNLRPRRQELVLPGLSKNTVENGAMYINTVENWIAYKCRLTEPVGEFKMGLNSLVEIDTMKDWAFVERLLGATYGA